MKKPIKPVQPSWSQVPYWVNGFDGEPAGREQVRDILAPDHRRYDAPEDASYADEPSYRNITILDFKKFSRRHGNIPLEEIQLYFDPSRGTLNMEGYRQHSPEEVAALKKANVIAMKKYEADRLLYEKALGAYEIDMARYDVYVAQQKLANKLGKR